MRGVQVQKRSALSIFLQVLLLLSGWAVAIWLSGRPKETPKIVELPVPVAIEAPKPPTLAEKIDEIFRAWQAKPELEGALVGFCVLGPDGEIVYGSPLAGRALCPASALKTVTTGAAFGLLGPEFRFETTLAGSAPLGTDGNLDGDLVLVGGGDPTFSQENLVALADAAVAAGLKRVSGRVVVDTSVLPEDPANEFWNWGDVGNGYGAGAFGLNIDRNQVEITFRPGMKAGEPAKLVDGEPVVRDMKWLNHVVTGPADGGDEVTVYSEPYGRTITLRGTVPAGEKLFTIYGANPDPPAFAAELLRERLESKGVKFAAQPSPSVSGKRTTISSHRSEPLPEIVDHLHRVSDNLESQCLFLTMGKLQDSNPADVMRDYWRKAGIEFAGLRMLDGSGLARATMIRPLDLARVNRAARGGPHGERFYQSLSTYQNGTIRSKLGAMSGVKTEVGFLRIAGNREVTFALMANGLDTSVKFWPIGRELLDAVRAIEW
jgi:serine-type D-Ala-D-Ala carboxypeptidase/endopeptidase (penicillin-binding protein 4)